jgi:hypothetical protein
MAQPGYLALEEERAVAAWEIGHGHGGEGDVAKELALREERGGPRPKESHRRRPSELTQVRDAGIQGDEHGCTRDQMPKLP